VEARIAGQTGLYEFDSVLKIYGNSILKAFLSLKANHLNVVKIVAFNLGALAAYHYVRNRRTLTVVTFHRVLPLSELERYEADPIYTVTPRLFEEIVKFLKKYYCIVHLDDVIASRRHIKRLPRRALLITFDDGWYDNYEYALPILKKHGVSATLFAASDAIREARTTWWQEVVGWALRTGRGDDAILRRLEELGQRNDCLDPTLRLLVDYGELDPSTRDNKLARLTQEMETLSNRRQMLDIVTLQALARQGFAIGLHGAAHLPLTFLSEPGRDLYRALSSIKAYLDVDRIASLSFPHGRYDERVITAARQLGLDLLFSSDAVINVCPGGYIPTDILGRIPIYQGFIQENENELSDRRICQWMFLRSRARLKFDHGRQ